MCAAWRVAEMLRELAMTRTVMVYDNGELSIEERDRARRERG